MPGTGGVICYPLHYRPPLFNLRCSAGTFYGGFAASHTQGTSQQFARVARRGWGGSSVFWGTGCLRSMTRRSRKMCRECRDGSFRDGEYVCRNSCEV
ncbi:hypothetical protein CDAR_208341 [Caerostris darwini]|uniref:Uncharacterized protein n=1 Tax=Caerostris darwini TaxID=1538125 RepID=A0AAV4RED2_9ARAC|nr:hypothetical protein CDAR_208341 [Caerostris darwini]